MVYTAPSFKWHLFCLRASGLELCNVKASYPRMVSGFNCNPVYSGIFFFQILLLGATVALLTNSLLCEDSPQQHQVWTEGLSSRSFLPRGGQRPCRCPRAFLLQAPRGAAPAAGAARSARGGRGWGGSELPVCSCPSKGIPACAGLCAPTPLSALLEGVVQQLCLPSSASQGRSFQIKSFNSSFAELQQEPFAGGTAASKYLWFHRCMLAKTSEFHSLPGVFLRSCHQSLGSEAGATGCISLHVCISNET